MNWDLLYLRDDDDWSQGRSYPRTVSNAYGFVKDSFAIFMYEVILWNQMYEIYWNHHYCAEP